MQISNPEVARLKAHTPRPGTDEWEPLVKHLADVAIRAEELSGRFGHGNYGAILGLFHDLGKCNPKFQDYLIDCFNAEIRRTKKPETKVPHSIWGAAFAHLSLKRFGGNHWAELALPILAHHSALADVGLAEQRLFDFEDRNKPWIPVMQGVMRAAMGLLPRKVRIPAPSVASSRERELLLRMMYSVLIDADRLCTERFTDPEQSQLRTELPSLDQLWQRFKGSVLAPSEQSTSVRGVREEVLASCLASFDAEPGLFRLTVPTGGGKTRSGLAFALHHADKHGLERIIVALPYTSIVDQTARIYREILGEDAVVEHHSAVEIDDDEEEDAQSVRARLATENWDARIIVTTTVQLFESLFAARASKARKIHRLARSVIILDEIQAFPAELLRPTLDVLHLLATPVAQGGYGASVVLSTATQPAFEVGPLATVLPCQPRQLVPNFDDHYQRLHRVTYRWDPTPKTWTEVATELRAEAQALVILNTRKDALALVDALEQDGGGEEVFHLSTLLCGAHRRMVLQRVMDLLADDRPVKLISTQVVECGVDIDFPVVYRALGPLDRIVQAAGRCNREGRRSAGTVVVFEPASGATPRGPYKIGTEKARHILETRGEDALHDPDTYRLYFGLLHQDVDADGGLDKHCVQDAREAFEFPKVAEKYRVIKEPTVPVVVQYGVDWDQRLNDWLDGPSRGTWQHLQPIVVNLFERNVRTHREWLDRQSEKVDLYLWIGTYDSKRHRGIVAGFPDPSDLFVMRDARP